MSRSLKPIRCTLVVSHQACQKTGSWEKIVSGLIVCKIINESSRAPRHRNNIALDMETREYVLFGLRASFLTPKMHSLFLLYRNSVSTVVERGCENYAESC